MRVVITENMLLLKYPKQAITAALNGEDALMLLPTASGKLWQELHRGCLKQCSIDFVQTSRGKNCKY